MLTNASHLTVIYQTDNLINRTTMARPTAQFKAGRKRVISELTGSFYQPLDPFSAGGEVQ